jgi:poly-gamma-glutamate synthesis protein (capsule biosynthesis protein)
MNFTNRWGAILATLLFAALLLAGCGQAPSATLPAATIAAATPLPAATATATPRPTATDQPTATPTNTPQPTATPTATATPQRLTLAAAPEWEGALAAALEGDGDSLTPGYEWTLLIADDPAAELAAGRAQAALVVDGAGAVVREEPLAFSVPFTTNWELINAADAAAILANGHNLVRVIPWSGMTPENKALRVDGLHPTDPDYPYRRVWTLAAAPDHAAAAGALAPPLAEALAPLPTIRLAAVGDVNFDRAPADILLTTGDASYAFSRVKHIFDAADYTVANLETSLGDVGEPAAKRYTFQSPPEAAGAIAAGGIDLVSLANNHALDYGPEALLQGIDLLNEAGVATIGGGADDNAAHAPHIADIGGLRVAFLGYVHVPIEAVTNFDTQSWTATADAPGLAWADPARVRADVAAIRPEVDLVVVVLHSGYEYIEEPGEEQVAAARAAVDAGADLVIGHHAHILQGIHRYHDGVIAYGLGNFHFDIDGPPETAILNVWLDRDGVRQLELIPAIIQEHGQPWPAEWWQAEPILARVYYLTTILNASP